MNPTVAVLLAVAAIGIIIAALVEVSKYFRGQSIISGRQLGLRVVMAVLLLAIVALGLWGMVYFQRRPEPFAVVVFGLALVLLAVAVMVLAVVDRARCAPRITAPGLSYTSAWRTCARR